MKTITINQENTIESIIEFHQQFAQKYNLKIKKLDQNIQYQINNTKIHIHHKETQHKKSTTQKTNKRSKNNNTNHKKHQNKQHNHQKNRKDKQTRKHHNNPN